MGTDSGGTPVRLADINGDGKAGRKDSVVPDLLKRHTLASGGTVDTEFLPSTYWTNGYLPMVVQAVSKVTLSLIHI